MLPINDIIPDLRQKLQYQNIVILQAPPGAGKSTVLPLELLNEAWLRNQKILMLEPRRLAARSVAFRMADLQHEEIGKTIGYQVRFENMTNANTRIDVLTEGILTRKIQSDSSLEGVGLVIFDEFHERSLHADLALALCLQVQQLLREDLRILIMSATLESEKLASTLKAPVITSTGRQFPVKIEYQTPARDASIADSVTHVIKKAVKEQNGDLLVFLPGVGEIKQVSERFANESFVALPLYGDLPYKQQQEAILPLSNGSRKVVLATTIAETSLTIEGITTVIDCGYTRAPKFDPRSGLTKLETIRVAKDAADQRAGRAGRLGPGVCYRLWPEATHQHLRASRQPEIVEADLSSFVLELASWGVNDVFELNWITPPPVGAINQAVELLNDLGALYGKRITERGKQILKLPTHPRIAHMLLCALNTNLAIDIAAILEERDPLPKEVGSDLSLRVEILRKWRANEKVNADRNVLQRIERLATSWRKIFKTTADNSIVADTDVGALLMEAYPERVAQQIDKQGYRFKLVNGRVAKLPEHDALHREKWLCIAQLDAGHTEGKIFLAAPVAEADVVTRTKETEVVKWDSDRGMVVGVVEKRLGNLMVSSKAMASISDDQRTNTLLLALREEGLKLIGWGDAECEWQARVTSLAKWLPDENWPDVSDDALIARAHEWLAPFLTGISKRTDLEKLDLHVIVQTILPWEYNNRCELLAPLKLQVPSGSHIRIQYSIHGDTPKIEVRLQEMFGLLETPTVNEGRTKIMLHLLSPGYKPVQVTQDLRSFWQTTYHEVRSELHRRYPRHHWPEDPWTAEAVRGAVKRSKQ